MAGYEPVEPVGAVSSIADGQQHLNAIQGDTATQELRWKTALSQKNASHTYSCYILMIQMINHLSLDKIDGEVIAESQMMNVEQAMQSKMIDISKFISQIQQQATAYSPDVMYQGFFQNMKWTPDSFTGLKTDFYKIGQGDGDLGQETPSADYKKGMDSFISAFKTLFYSNTDDNAPTVASLSKIMNPNVFQGGQDFDLTGTWAKLSAQYSIYDRSYTSDMGGGSYSTPVNYKVISTDPNDKASLIQQYMYYKAMVTVDSTSTNVVNSAQGDITKIIDLGTDQDGDSFLQQAMQVITMFNSSENAQRVTPSNFDSSPPGWTSTQSDNVLDLMLQDQRFNYNSSGTEKVGLYGAFSYKGFNYFWSKATSGSDQEAPPELPSHNVFSVTANGVGGSDSLTGETTSANNVVTSLGTVTGTESTKMQELTSNEGENVNIAQSVIKSLNTSVDTYSQNQIDS